LLKLDCRQAYSILKWHSVYNIDEALQKKIEWYKKYYNVVRAKELYEFTIEQIEKYMKGGGYCAGD